MSSKNESKGCPISPAGFRHRSFEAPAARAPRRWAAAVLSGCLAAALCGCAGYRLGPSNGLAAGSASVQITPFINQTIQPHLTDYVTAQMHKEIQVDGTYKLATHDDGDIIVNGVMTAYDRAVITLASDDIMTAQDYRLTLTAHVIARERATGKTVLDQMVTGVTIIRVFNDLTSSERQAMPLLAQDLAEKVTALLADGKW